MKGAEIESFGFKVTPNTMTTARKHAAENGAGSPVPKPQQPPFEKHIINLSKKAKITHPNKNDIIPSSDDDSVLAGMMARFSFAM